MRLSNLCILMSLVWLLLLLASALLLGAELLEPGFDVFPPTRLFWFNRVANLHATIGAISLPLTLLVGVGFAMLSERGAARRILLAVSAIALAVSVAAPMASIIGWNGTGPALDAVAGTQGQVAIAGLALVAIAGNAARSGLARTSVWLYFGLGTIASVAALGPVSFLSDERFLHATYFSTGIAHAFGVALVLFGFGMMMRWIEPDSRPVSTIVTLVHGLVLVASGAAMTAIHLQLGLSGMPKGYPDYPHTFTGMHQIAIFAGLVFALSFGLGVLRLVRLARRTRTSPIDTFS